MLGTKGTNDSSRCRKKHHESQTVAQLDRSLEGVFGKKQLSSRVHRALWTLSTGVLLIPADDRPCHTAAPASGYATVGKEQLCNSCALVLCSEHHDPSVSYAHSGNVIDSFVHTLCNFSSHS